MKTEAQAIFDAPGKVGDMQLRPYTVGSFNMCARLGLSIFTGDAQAEDATKEAQIWQMAAYLWVHTGDISDRLDALETGKAKREIDIMMFDLPMDSIEEIMAKIMASNDKIAAAQFEVQDKPSDKKASKETPPPNS